MAWESLVAWANGQLITSVRLNAVHANIDFLRDEVKYREVMLRDQVVRCEVGGGTDVYTRIRINGTLVHQSISISTSWTLRTAKDLDISGLSAGVHEIALQGGATPQTVITSHFVKTADMTRLTALFENRTATDGGLYYIEFRLVRMFVHRDAWPW